MKKQVELSGYYTGFRLKVPYENVPYYYNLGTVFVTASTTETQGLTLIEAMSTSMPVVCIDDESFRNTIIDGLNGFTFNNKKEYRKEIDDLINDNKLLKKLGEQAKISTSEYSSKYYAERVLDVYKKTIEENQTNKSFLGRTKDVIKNGFKN